MHPLENKILDILDGDALRLVRVVRASDAKLQAEDAAGRGVRVTAKQVVSQLGTAATAADFAGQAGKLHDALAELAAGVDPELLWDSVREDRREHSLAELARTWFSQDGAREQSALARALLSDTLHFKRNGAAFTPRSADEVAQVRLQQQRQEERNARRERLSGWLRELLRAPGETAVPETALDDERKAFLDLAASFMLEAQNNEAAKLLEEARPKQPPRETGLELLRRTGRLPADADPFLLRHGVVAAFPAAVERHAAGLAGFAESAPGRTDLTHLELFSVDDDSTREIDDALSLETLPDGRRVAGIHIADPATFIHRNDPLDRAAFDRTLTLYLPTTTVTMLPHRVGCELASLNRGEPRPALSFLATFRPDGTLEAHDIVRSRIRVAHRLTYEEADAALAGETAPLHAALAALRELAGILRAERLAAGALQLVRREVDVFVRNGEILLKTVDDTPSRQVVSEFMILANRLTAEFALAHDLPFIYRSQEAPTEPLPPMTAYDPVLFSRLVRTLKKTRLTTQPLPHAGLGLGLYTQISSPLRRYADLVLQRQLAAKIAGEELPYNAAELIEVLGAADAAEALHRQIEREATNWWLLEWLRRGGDAPHDAVALGGMWVELTDAGIRGKLAAGSADAGETFPVRVERADPDRALLVVARLPA